ncbi:hypothetical protein JW964_08400, partial [candidate division KSB1 bacterium]|nr:hypothetical protein [candidate division KSB1 bacterium]
RLQRAGYLRQISADEVYFPRTGTALLQQIENLLSEKMEQMNGQRIKVPIFGDNLTPVFQNPMSTESYVVTHIANKEIHSYRQLPALLFSVQPQWAADKQPNYLWPFSNEVTQMTFYLFAQSEHQIKEIRQKLQQQLLDFYKNIGITIVPTILNPKHADSIEFISFHPEGDQVLIKCPQCGYQAAQIHAQISKPAPATEPLSPIEKVATPDTTTIEALAKLLNVPESKTAKAVFRMAEIDEGEKRFVFAVVRGDMELNEFKLAQAIGARKIQPADESQILATGAVPGYASPIGLKDLLVVVDDLIPKCTNLVAGANETRFHLLNTNFGRDYQATQVTDIVMARSDDPCPICSAPLQANSFFSLSGIHPPIEAKINSKPVTYLNSNGQTNPVWLGSGWLHFEPIISLLAEIHQDENGLCWPMAISPYQIYIILLANKQNDPLVIKKAELLYHSLLGHGIKALFDDRSESPGVKFSDADLLGIPLRITVSNRSLEQGGVEFKCRESHQKQIVLFDDVHSFILNLL